MLGNTRFPVSKRVARLACCLALLVCLMGCGSAQEVVEAPGPDLWKDPLTVADWQKSTDIEKYSPEILERLRIGNKELQSPEKWKRFHSEVVLPGFNQQVARKQSPSGD